MREFIAVNDPITFAISREAYPLPDISFLKREALMFDRIAIPRYREAFIENTRLHSEFPEVIQELEWLFEKGIIFEPEQIKGANISNEEHQVFVKSAKDHAKELLSLFMGFDIDEARNDDAKEHLIQKRLANISNLPVNEMRGFVFSEDFKKTVELMTSNAARAICIELRELKNLDAYPVFRRDLPVSQTALARKDDVIEITLNALPVPDEMTSWEHILEFKDDPDSRSKFLALRNWMNDVSRNNLTPIEIEQKLEYLMDQYQRHMQLHKMITNTGTMQTIVVSTAEFIEDLMKLKWGKIARSLFAFRDREIALLQGELKSPGSEVAYIIKAQGKLSTVA